MNYRIALALLIFFSVLSSNLFAASFTFDMDATMEQASNPPVTMTNHYYVKGDKYRAEISSHMQAGQKIIYIFDGVKSYQYFPDKNMAMVMTIPDTMKDNLNKISSERKNCDCQTIAGSSFKVINQTSDMLDGKACTVCEMQGTTGNENLMKMWLVKGGCSVIQMQSEAAGRKTTMHYYNIVENAVIGDDMFTIPSDAKITDMSSMISGMGGADMQKMMEKIKR